RLAADTVCEFANTFCPQSRRQKRQPGLKEALHLASRKENCGLPEAHETCRRVLTVVRMYVLNDVGPHRPLQTREIVSEFLEQRPCDHREHIFFFQLNILVRSRQEITAVKRWRSGLDR